MYVQSIERREKTKEIKHFDAAESNTCFESKALHLNLHPIGLKMHLWEMHHLVLYNYALKEEAYIINYNGKNSWDEKEAQSLSSIQGLVAKHSKYVCIYSRVF